MSEQGLKESVSKRRIKAMGNEEEIDRLTKDDEGMHQVNIALTFMVAANGLRKAEEDKKNDI